MSDRLDELGVDQYLAECVQIEPLAIEEEFVRVPADLAYWNERYTRAVDAFHRAKIRVSKLEALLSIEHREALTANGKATEKMIEAAVESDQRLLDARDSLVNAEVEKVRLAGYCEAVRTKRDMIISIGAHLRAEMGGDPSIRSQQAGARKLRNDRG